MPPEIQAELVHDMLDRQYRSLIDEPVPMLGDISPRAASKTARGHKILIVWLKHLENHSRRADELNDPMATYDFMRVGDHQACRCARVAVANSICSKCETPNSD